MIKLDNLAIGYNGMAILPPITHIFADNQIVGILGTSGKGKSTLLKTIAGLIPPVEGKVNLFPEPESKSTNPVYMMHQKYTNFDWLTCVKNILIVQRDRKLRKTKEEYDRALEVLKQVGLYEYWNKWPTQLSGGMQQRLALARVLYARPRYLLMDEPLSALDDETRAVMQELVMKLHKELCNTILLVTHSEAEADLMCDYKYYIGGNVDGKEIGWPREKSTRSVH